MQYETTKEANDRIKKAEKAQSRFRRDRRKLVDALQTMLDSGAECAEYRAIIERRPATFSVGSGFEELDLLGDGYVGVVVVGAIRVMVETLKQADF